MTEKVKTGGKNKRAGSTFEREVAKILSMWIYGKESVIRRHPTSGSEKDYGQGADISVFQPGYDNFEYFVEVKRGYKQDLFNARKQILDWYETTKNKNKKNYPVWIVWKLLNRGIILATNTPFKKIIPLFILNDLHIYDFKELVKHKFSKIKGD